MGLSVYLECPCCRTELFESGTTHNLVRMAREAGNYYPLWRPEELGFTKGKDLIEPLKKSLRLLRFDPDYFKLFDSPNGWGVYEHFYRFVLDYWKACVRNPEALIRVSR